MRTKLMLTLAALMTLPIQTALAQSTDRPGYGHGYWGSHWGGWFMGPVMMLIFIAVVVFVVWFVRQSGGNASRHPSDHNGSSEKTPLDILKERFAKGEIDKEEFEERRRVLGD